MGFFVAISISANVILVLSLVLVVEELEMAL
jgi:hypothetical protein